ncbi:MAG: hypothetical protein L6R42_002377, partial [Xanthoria sp. 1 TBL-2021]
LGLQRASSQKSTSFAFQSLQRKLNIVSLHRSVSESATELIGSLGLTLFFEPEEVLADFIFVHGFRGGSRKTWSFSADPAHFWPKELLPGEPDFKNDTKAYITNLERSSEAQEVISDSFRHYYSGINLHSFLESIPMNLGYGSALVVDRSSATLGYTEERVQFLNADHRSICKNAAQGMQQIHREHMRQLSSYLNISDAPVDDLTAYQDWQYNNDSPKYFWFRGKPAMGKSMTSSHVVQQLEGTQCSYFFFKHNDRLKSSLAVFLRSMAYQMANFNRSVRQQLIELEQDEPFLEMENARNIWRKVFGVVFKAQYHQPHYWVIDALDECKAAESHDFGGLFGFLAKIDEDVPLKLFITSRFTSELERLVAPLHPITEQVTAEYTTHDIRGYVELYSDSLPGESKEEQNHLAESTISKSWGCFLWAVVVIQQLKQVILFEETEDILRQVPQEMQGLYMRSLQVLSTKTKYKHLTLSILNWTVCSMRALTRLELNDALKLDISQTIFKDLKKLYRH